MATEGQIAVGPNGERAVFRGGQWVVMPAEMPADPTFPHLGAEAAARAQRAQAGAQVDQATIPSQITATNASATQTERAAATEGLPPGFMWNRDGTAAIPIPGVPEDEDTSEERQIRKGLQTDETIRRIQEAGVLAQQAMSAGNFFGSGAFQFLPFIGQDSANLSAKLEGLKGGIINDMLQELKALSPTGASGFGNFSDTEGDRLAASIASLQQTQEPAELAAELQRLERHYRVGRAILDGEDPRKPEVAKAYGLEVKDGEVSLPGTRNTAGGEQYQVGISERFATENDKKVAVVLQAAFDRGAGADELNAIVRQYGYPNLNPREIATAIQYRDQGGKGVKVNVPQSGYRDPSITERAIASVAQSPVGTYFGQAANALTFGGLDELQGIARGDSLGEALSGTGRHTTEANLQKSLQAQGNPMSALLGNLSGGVIGALGTGALAGAGRVAATTFAPRAMAGDALYGGLYGAGESNEGRLGGAALGTVAGVGGGALGRGAARRAADAIGGVGGPGAYLRQEGVTLTPGQIGESMNQATPGGSGLGRFLKRREDRLAGFSGIGDAIGRQQERGVRQFDRAAFRQGLGMADAVPAEIAEAGIDEASDVLVPGAYTRALDGQNFVADQQFTQGMGSALNRARNLPAIGDETAYSLEQAVAPFVDPAGNIPGRNMQNITQELQRRAARFDNSPSAVGPDAANVLRGALDDVGGMVERQAPGLMEDFANANTAYRNMKILEDAVARGINTDGLFTPAQLGQAARANAKKYGGRYASQDRPFFDLQRAGQQILPSKVPDSGTAGRQAAGDGITGALKALARNARLPIYSDPAVELLNLAAFARPEAARAIGETVRRGARIGGLFGAPAMTYAAN